MQPASFDRLEQCELGRTVGDGVVRRDVFFERFRVLFGVVHSTDYRAPAGEAMYASGLRPLFFRPGGAQEFYSALGFPPDIGRACVPRTRRGRLVCETCAPVVTVWPRWLLPPVRLPVFPAAWLPFSGYSGTRRRPIGGCCRRLGNSSRRVSLPGSPFAL